MVRTVQGLRSGLGEQARSTITENLSGTLKERSVGRCAGGSRGHGGIYKRWSLGPFRSPPCLDSLIPLTRPTLVRAGQQCCEGDSSSWGIVSGYRRSPVEDEGNGKVERVLPHRVRSEKSGSHLQGQKLGGSCSPTEAHHDHSPLPTQAQSPTPRWSLHPVLGT